jgi:hypothetical protein
MIKSLFMKRNLILLNSMDNKIPQANSFRRDTDASKRNDTRDLHEFGCRNLIR